MGLRRAQVGRAMAPARDAEAALAALADADVDVRRRAATELRGNPAATPVLCARLAVERDRAVRGALVTAIAAIGDDAAARGTALHLRSDDAATRAAALEALELMPAAARRVLGELLDDGDPDVRILAATAAAAPALAGAELRARLVALVERDAHVNVCMAALEGLRDDPAARAALAALPARFPDDPYVAFAVAALDPERAP